MIVKPYELCFLVGLLALAGTLIIHAGGGWLNVVGYIVLTAGLCGCFYQLRSSPGEEFDLGEMLEQEVGG